MASLPFVVPIPPTECLVLYITSNALVTPDILRISGPQTGTDVGQPAAATVAGTPQTLFGLLSGSLEDFRRYSGLEGAQWLLDAVRGICCPRASGNDVLWKHDRASDSWHQVGTADPLCAASYFYQPPGNTPVRLTMIYAPKDPDDESYKHCGGKLRERLGARDGACWVSRVLAPLCAVHFFPEAMDVAHVQRGLYDFSAPGEPALVPPVGGRWQDERLAILLTLNLEYYFSRYQLSFLRRISHPSQAPDPFSAYECHDFAEPVPDGFATVLTEVGQEDVGYAKLPPLHGKLVSPPNNQAPGLPPEAAFRWHYTQCIVHKFAHVDYRGVEGIVVPAPPICEEPPSCYEYGDPDCKCGGPTAEDRRRWGLRDSPALVVGRAPGMTSH